MNSLPIEDMSKTYLEHSMVIHNFVIKIGSQMKDSLCLYAAQPPRHVSCHATFQKTTALKNTFPPYPAAP